MGLRESELAETTEVGDRSNPGNCSVCCVARPVTGLIVAGSPTNHTQTISHVLLSRKFP